MRRKRVTNIVPPLVLSAAFVGVVPACALVSCGSSTTSTDVYFGGDVAADAFIPKNDVFSVACCFGVADATFGDVIDEPTTDADANDADDGQTG